MDGAVRTVVAVALLVPVSAGCGGFEFTAAVNNRTDRSWTVTVTLAYDDNGTEVFNRTLSLAAGERVVLEGFRQRAEANFTAEGRLGDGRTATTHLDSFHFCGSCTVDLDIEANSLHWVTSVIE